MKGREKKAKRMRVEEEGCEVRVRLPCVGKDRGGRKRFRGRKGCNEGRNRRKGGYEREGT